MKAQEGPRKSSGESKLFMVSHRPSQGLFDKQGVYFKVNFYKTWSLDSPRPPWDASQLRNRVTVTGQTEGILQAVFQYMWHDFPKKPSFTLSWGETLFFCFLRAVAELFRNSFLLARSRCIMHCIVTIRWNLAIRSLALRISLPWEWCLLLTEALLMWILRVSKQKQSRHMNMVAADRGTALLWDSIVVWKLDRHQPCFATLLSMANQTVAPLRCYNCNLSHYGTWVFWKG